MKKELKELIKKLKLSDDDLIKLINSNSESESESDVKDEEEESEDAADSEEQQQAEAGSAQKESPKKKEKKDLSMKDLEGIIQKSVIAALKAKEDAEKLPSQKPIKKAESKPKQDKTADFQIGGFNLVI